MKCEKCGDEIDVGGVNMSADCMNGIDVEVSFQCPNCDASYSNFFDAEAGFVLVDEE